MKPTYTPISPCLGELVWSAPPSDSLLAQQLAWMDYLKTEFKSQTIEIRLGFTALSIRWKNPELQTEFQKTIPGIQLKERQLSSKIQEIPVCYDPIFGPDLNAVASRHQMAVSELVAIHSSVTYRLHFFGFLPGFMYLSGLPESLHTPRKSIPERTVQAGSVAIGGSQTGIYPMDSPGGLHIIGKCPLKLFDATKNPPLWAEPGDLVRFRPIGLAEMEGLLTNPIYPKHYG